MKRFILLALMLIVAVSASAQVAVLYINDPVTGYPKAVSGTLPVPTQADANSGYLDVATPSFTISNTVPTDISSYLPTGSKGFALNVFDGDIIVGYSSDLATGSHFVGKKVASGSEYIHRGLTGTLHIFGLSTAASATATLQAWGKQ